MRRFFSLEIQNYSNTYKKKTDELGDGKAQEGCRAGKDITPSRAAAEVFDDKADDSVVDEKEGGDLAFEAPSSVKQQKNDKIEGVQACLIELSRMDGVDELRELNGPWEITFPTIAAATQKTTDSSH